MARLATILQVALCTLLFATTAHAQEIASADPTHPPAATSDTSANQEKNELPNGCKSMAVGYADGTTVQGGREPKKISVELTKISDTTLIFGAGVNATVKLQNLGSESIQIPWSTDIRTARDKQEPNNRTWELGRFQIKLVDQSNRSVELKTTSGSLFSSTAIPGSILTLKPGEWVTAQISFKVEEQNPAYQRLVQGSFGLIVEWFQTGRSEKVQECNRILGFFPYGDSYLQNNPPVAVKVEKGISDKTKEPTQ